MLSTYSCVSAAHFDTPYVLIYVIFTKHNIILADEVKPAIGVVHSIFAKFSTFQIQGVKTTLHG
ncbi:MAG: hypothetical protein EPGJADBJ_02093 [Saprospiraceae bacterium]|nr:hypothetical protein [Saprospiraceae bacterium]